MGIVVTVAAAVFLVYLVVGIVRDIAHTPCPPVRPAGWCERTGRVCPFLVDDTACPDEP